MVKDNRSLCPVTIKKAETAAKTLILIKCSSTSHKHPACPAALTPDPNATQGSNPTQGPLHTEVPQGSTSLKLVEPVSTARALADWVRVSCQRTTRHLLGPGVQLSIYARVYETGSRPCPGGAAAEKCLPVLPTLSWEAAFLLEAEQPLKGGREGCGDLLSRDKGTDDFSLPIWAHFKMAQKCWPRAQPQTGWEHKILKTEVAQEEAQLAYGDHHLDAPLQAVFQVPARRVVREEGEARMGGLPHARLLVQPLEELVNCGGAVKTHHLPGEGTS